MDISALIILAAALAWASGINVYAVILTVGLFGAGGYIDLPAPLHFLTHPMTIGAAALMFAVEFVADKVPGLDSAWDAVHTLIRIPVGAALAAAAVGQAGWAFILPAVGLGGALATGSHFTKAGTRVVVNTSPEPFSNWAVSIAEDLLVVAGLWLAIRHPWLFVALLCLFIALAVWLAPKLWRGIKRVMETLARLFAGRPLTRRFRLTGRPR